MTKGEAARINGATSSGRITPKGKATSSMNAPCAKSLVLTNEDEEKFQMMRDGYLQHFKPEGEVELNLIEEVISSRWRQRRIWGADGTTHTAVPFMTLSDTSQTTLHEALYSRQYRLAMKTLIQMQKNRKKTNLQNEPKPPGKISPVTPIDVVRPAPQPSDLVA
jgi:hypothetical protein